MLGLGDGRTSSGVISLVTWHPATWWTASLAPSAERLSAGKSTTAATAAATGLADLPYNVSAQHQWTHAQLQPSLIAAVAGLVPTGDAASGLGGGHGVASLSLGGSVQATDNIELNSSATREVTHEPGAISRPVSLQADVNTQLGDRAGLDVGWSRDVAMLNAQPAYASISVGASWQLGHHLVAAMDWSRSTVGAGAARQVLQGVSIGIGMVVPSFVPSNGDPAEARGRSGAGGRQRVIRGKAKGKTKTSTS